MTTVLLVGASGRAGSAMAPLLLAHTDCRVVLAARRLERLSGMAALLTDEYGPGRVDVAQVDLAEASTLRSQMSRSDLAVIASSTARHAVATARTVIEAGRDYLDVHFAPGLYGRLRELDLLARQRGSCVLTEAGFHPGLPAVLVRHVARSIELETAEVAACIRMQLGDDAEMPDSMIELVEGLRRYDTRTLRNGRWRRPRLRWLWPYGLFDFGPPFNRRLVVPLELPELLAVPQQVPWLRRLGFYMAGFDWLTDWITMPLCMAASLIPSARLTRQAARGLFWSIRRGSRPPFGTVLKLVGRGRGAAGTVDVSLALRHVDEYALTAIPVVAAIRQYVSGDLRGPGIHMMGCAVDPGRLLADMEAMGVVMDGRLPAAA